MIRRLAAMAILGVAIISLSFGCSSSASKVEVKVTLDGSPLSGAAVVFSSDVSPVIYSGATDDNGIAKITQNNKDGVPAGNYKVAISKTETVATTGDPTADMKKMGGNLGGGPPGGAGGGGMRPPGAGGPGAPSGGSKPKALIPTKYGDPSLSGLTYSVPDDTKSVKEFSLTSK